MKIWLIGMMGSGKTSAGQIAARNLGQPFVDTDLMIEERAGVSVAALWAEEGEEAFRQLEKSVVAELVEANGIVATGGGVVLDEENRRLLADSGKVVWLDATPSALAARVAGSDDRPLLADAGDGTEAVLTTKMRERRSLYESVADHHIRTDRLRPEQVAGEIEALWTS